MDNLGFPYFAIIGKVKLRVLKIKDKFEENKMKRKSTKIFAIILSIGLITSQGIPSLAFEKDEPENIDVKSITESISDSDIDDKTEIVSEEEQIDSDKKEIINVDKSEPKDIILAEENKAAEENKVESNVEKNDKINSNTDVKAVQTEDEKNFVQEDSDKAIKKTAAKTTKNTADSTVADGTYIPTSFNFKGGTGKVTIECPMVTVKDGKATAKITFSSTGYYKVRIGSKIYNPIQSSVSSKPTYYLPVNYNTETVIYGTTNTMSEDHEIKYEIKAIVDSNSKKTVDPDSGKVPSEDTSKIIPNGVYKPDSFKFGGGSGRVTITCPEIEMRDGKATASIVFSSKNYIAVKVDGREYTGTVNEEAKTTTFKVPININEDFEIVGTTVAMSSATDVNYIIHAKLSADSEKIGDIESTPGTGEPSTPSDKPEVNPPNPPVNPNPGDEDKPGSDKPVDNKDLKDGTYLVKVDTDNRMFYIQPDAQGNKYATLVKSGKSLKVTIALTGQGYDALYLSSAENAEKAPKSEWSKFKEVNGYYTYTFEIPKLDINMVIAAHSKSHDKWYDHTIIFYSNGAKLVKPGTSTVPEKPSGDNQPTKPQNPSPNKPSTDGSGNVKDGYYTPDSFTFKGGTNKVTITCPEVQFKNGKATATIVFSSKYYTKLKVNGKTYKPVVDENARTSTFKVPVDINKNIKVVGTTVAMSEAHDVEYVINIGLKVGSQKPSTKPTVTPPTKPTTPNKPDNKPPATKKDLKDGTYLIKADTDNRMFYIQPDAKGNKYVTLVKKGDKLKVTIALTGQGYDALYLSNVKNASKAPKSERIKFKSVNGYYTYTFEIPKLDTNLVISAHSKKYDKWYEHTIIFYSGGAKLVKAGTSTVPQNQNNSNRHDNENVPPESTKTDNKEDKVSSSHKDTNQATSVVDSSTGLKDGVYTPDSFSWSGGTGRLAYIACNKITVTNGQAYATIVFGSTTYDQLKANGRVYSKQGNGLSTFVIPVKLNSNNTIVGRTVAMSAPHWIKYSIYIASSAAANSKGSGKVEAVDKNALSEKAPELLGLEAEDKDDENAVKYSKLFQLHNYNDGIKLLSVNIKKNSAIKYKKNEKSSNEIEYDEEGKPIAKSQSEITEELYHNNVINYLLVPEGVEVPAGLDKECIIVKIPAEKTYVASEKVMEIMEDMDILKSIAATGIDTKDIKNKDVKKYLEKSIKDEDITFAGDMENMDYKTLIKSKIELAIFDGSLIPEKIEKKDEKGKDIPEKELKAMEKEAKKQKKDIEKIEKKFSTLSIPVIFDRSNGEKKEDKLAKAEWIKFYGALFGCQDEANKIFNDYVKKVEGEKNEK